MAQDLLRSRYPQYCMMQLAELPVIAIRIENVASWGDLSQFPELTFFAPPRRSYPP